MKKQKLTLIRGVPGSGKSTLGKTLEGTLVEADMYFINKQGVYHFNPKKLNEAHYWCQKKVETELKKGHHVIVANTFIKLWELQYYLDLPKRLELDIEVEIVELEGRFKSIHNIPQKTINRMKAEFQSLKNTL